MEITTKFNINDEVWFLHPLSQRAVIGKVRGIRLEVRGKPLYKTGSKRDLIRTGEYTPQMTVNIYTVDDHVRKEGCTKSEYDLFKTKEELVNKLKERADKL